MLVVSIESKVLHGRGRSDYAVAETVSVKCIDFRAMQRDGAETGQGCITGRRACLPMTRSNLTSTNKATQTTVAAYVPMGSAWPTRHRLYEYGAADCRVGAVSIGRQLPCHHTRTSRNTAFSSHGELPHLVIIARLYGDERMAPRTRCDYAGKRTSADFNQYAKTLIWVVWKFRI
jgi:hypothetical protein